ncbi:CENP-B N-terminal DNA-binding domain [Popillia japonica]|uniref:CENP-B N-terminal DNA-binding domain n=1 Tax=Popillia japonica TaxID=7064 RepID=A0AAW1JBI8_POPJA
MTRIYKSDPHGKQYKKISVSVMETAKRAVLVNKMSIRGAAKKYNIPYSVLQRHIKNKNLKQQGGQTVLTPQEEASITERLKICAEWGYPLNLMGLRLIIKTYLDSQGRTIKIFKENMPGREFAEGFLKRHKEQIAERFCQNIKHQNLPCSEEEEELTKETNSAVIADVPITVTKFGKTFQNVCVVKKENINVDDWLLVAFNVDNKNPGPSNKYLYYICKVIKTSSDEIQGRFLRKKTTTDFSSKIYIFPDVEDVSNFDFEEVIGKVDTPEILRRSQFKFTIDTNNLQLTYSSDGGLAASTFKLVKPNVPPKIPETSAYREPVPMNAKKITDMEYKKCFYISMITMLSTSQQDIQRQPLINRVNMVSQSLAIPLGASFSLDEAIEPYFGHHHMKQFIKGKPIRYGFKFWCLNSSEGYLLKFCPYCGAGDKNEDAIQPLTNRERIPPPKSSDCFFDEVIKLYVKTKTREFLE